MTRGAATSTPTIGGTGGELALAAVRPFGVAELYTLSGGHIFPFLDAAVKADLPMYDVRHEQTATFAAEATAKLTRRLGVAALTAGPGVTNGISALTTAHFNGSPLLVLGGRAPQARWGAGSLQELDHVPIVDTVTKFAATATSTAECGTLTHEAARAALTPHRGPAFVDYPLDVVFDQGSFELPGPAEPRGAAPDDDRIAAVAELLATAERPALLAGSDVYWDGAWDALRACVETNDLPSFANGLGRGCLPADHRLAFSRARRVLSAAADLVVVVGAPLDFRLSFGRFGDAKVVHVADSSSALSGHADCAATVSGDLGTILSRLADAPGRRRDDWVDHVRGVEAGERAGDGAVLGADDDPIKPTRIYGELRSLLDRDAIVVGDGGDFVSYAGRYVDSYEPGCWLDPGPYGCLGTGLGYALAARVVHPDRQVVLCLGDGAAGFSLMDVDSLVRHDLPVVMVVGNNGCWGLEKHPMQAVYGYDAAADLQEGCRYDRVVEALGGAGETVERPADIKPALERAFAADVPYLVNVLTDAGDAYPRRSNLA